MSGNQKTTPLFDLLSRGASTSASPAATPRAAKPVVRVELKPQGVSGGQAEATAPAYSGSGVVRLSTNAAYIGVAIMALVVIGAYIAGFKIGTAREAARIEKDLGAAFANRPSVTEPGIGQQPQPRPNNPSPQPPAIREGSGTPLATGPVLSPFGSIPDPRTSGLNYLALAVLPRTDCEAAIRFLKDNQVEAIAVPVDGAGNEVNNPDPSGRYKLFAFPGFAAGQLGSSAAQNLEAAVARLGPEWQKNHRGTSDFRRTQWIKKK